MRLCLIFLSFELYDTFSYAILCFPHGGRGEPSVTPSHSLSCIIQLMTSRSVCVCLWERERECVCVQGRRVMWRETGQSWIQAVLGAWRSLGKAWALREKWLLSSSTLTTPAHKFCLFLSWMSYLWIRTPVSLEGSVGVLLAHMLVYKPLINHNYCFRMSWRFFYGEDKPSLKYIFIFRVSLMPQRIKCFELCLC